MPGRSDLKGLIFSISRASAEDGPGIRTTVFHKGCPLRCLWCHSPQSQGNLKPRLTFYQNRCILCGACIGACPEGVHTISGKTKQIFWEKCDHCGNCVDACPSAAIEMGGRWLTVEQVMGVVRRDAAYYEKSGGGVTFSGGEPTLQPRFLTSCSKQCREEGIHTALDTSGYVEWPVLKRILPYIDLFLFDLKHMDSRQHECLTGVNNDLILANLERIDRQEKPIWIRIPLIPGYNDSEENLRQTAQTVRNLNSVRKISILPYNSAAGAKYRLIGRDYELEGLDYSPEREREIRRIFTNATIEIEFASR